jgi:AbrB family looped-hinge helix DNA binding protein
MLGITTVTQKGQVTIPIAIRNALGLSPFDKVQVRMREGSAVIEPVPDLLSMGGSIKPIKGKSALKSREFMENNYKSDLF